MSGYENAPATRMLATNCAACGRPLVDAQSVETGMGPDCRKKYGSANDVPEAARARANQLVYQVALAQGGQAIDGFYNVTSKNRALLVLQAAEELRSLGLGKLAAKVTKAWVQVHIVEEGGLLTVKTPFNENALGAWRMIPGRRWDGEKKVNTVPASQRRGLFAMLTSNYAGCVAVGPKGPFVLGK